MARLIDFQKSFHFCIFIQEFNESLFQTTAMRRIAQPGIDALLYLLGELFSHLDGTQRRESCVAHLGVDGCQPVLHLIDGYGKLLHDVLCHYSVLC